MTTHHAEKDTPVAARLRVLLAGIPPWFPVKKAGQQLRAIGREVAGIDARAADETVRASITTAMTLLLQEAVRATWPRGWHPADLQRVVARQVGVNGTLLLGDAIAAELATYAPSTIDPDWHEQVRELDMSVHWPATTTWAAHRLGEVGGRIDELTQPWAGTCHVLAHLPDIGRIGPLPGQARAGTVPTSAAVDARVLARVRAILAKAESTNYPAEAETFTDAAQKLMARHSIDSAMLAAAEPDFARHGPSARRIGVEAPYELPKVQLLNAVGDANRCRSVWTKEYGFVTLVGFAEDAAATETLFTSLLVQATRAMAAHGSRIDLAGQSRTRSFRQSFLTSFAARIGERLAEVARSAEDEAASGVDAEPLPDARGYGAEGDARGGAGMAGRDGMVGRGVGRELAKVLADRRDAVAAETDRLFPRVTTRGRSALLDREGWIAGHAAAETASLGARSGTITS